MTEQLLMFAPPGIAVEPITAEAAVYPFILKWHYAHRVPSISHAYGLYRDGDLVGVVTYGTPPSAPLRDGIAGAERAGDVLELNRLVLRDNLKNEASRLVGKSLRMLPARTIVVSYADPSQGHVGYVYQATNFRYTGLSAKRTDWKIRGLEHLHGQTVADMSRGQADRVGYMRERFGDDFYLDDRTQKHRYIWCRDRRDYAAVLYPFLPYPKVNRHRGQEQGCAYCGRIAKVHPDSGLCGTCQ